MGIGYFFLCIYLHIYNHTNVWCLYQRNYLQIKTQIFRSLIGAINHKPRSQKMWMTKKEKKSFDVTHLETF